MPCCALAAGLSILTLLVLLARRFRKQQKRPAPIPDCEKRPYSTIEIVVEKPVDQLSVHFQELKAYGTAHPMGRVSSAAASRLAAMDDTAFRLILQDAYSESQARKQACVNGLALPGPSSSLSRRNRAKRALSNLTLTDFFALARDLAWELERRYPHLSTSPRRLSCNSERSLLDYAQTPEELQSPPSYSSIPAYSDLAANVSSGAPVDNYPIASVSKPDSTISPAEECQAGFRDWLSEQITNWKGHDINTFGLLHLASPAPFQLARSTMPRVLEYDVYLFERIFIAVRPAKDGRVAELKGRIYTHNITNVAVDQFTLIIDWLCEGGTQQVYLQLLSQEEVDRWHQSLKALTS